MCTLPRRDFLRLLTLPLAGLERGDRETAALLPPIKKHLTERDRAMGEHGWATSFLSSHDFPRSVSRFGDPDPAWRDASAKVLGTLLLTHAPRRSSTRARNWA